MIRIDARFFKFVVVGGLAAMANVSSRILFSRVMPYVPAIVGAFCVGLATAFVCNRLIVFDNPENTLRSQILWFVAINLFGLLQTVLISLALAHWIFPTMGVDFYPETMAHAIGVAIPVFTSYIGHKHLTFQATR